MPRRAGKLCDEFSKDSIEEAFADNLKMYRERLSTSLKNKVSELYEIILIWNAIFPHSPIEDTHEKNWPCSEYSMNLTQDTEGNVMVEIFKKNDEATPLNNTRIEIEYSDQNYYKTFVYANMYGDEYRNMYPNVHGKIYPNMYPYVGRDIKGSFPTELQKMNKRLLYTICPDTTVQDFENIFSDLSDYSQGNWSAHSIRIKEVIRSSAGRNEKPSYEDFKSMIGSNSGWDCIEDDLNAMTHRVKEMFKPDGSYTVRRQLGGNDLKVQFMECAYFYIIHCDIPKVKLDKFLNWVCRLYDWMLVWNAYAFTESQKDWSYKSCTNSCKICKRKSNDFMDDRKHSNDGTERSSPIPYKTEPPSDMTNFCKTPGVIYLVTCSGKTIHDRTFENCQKRYVGKTKVSLSERYTKKGGKSKEKDHFQQVGHEKKYYIIQTVREETLFPENKSFVHFVKTTDNELDLEGIEHIWIQKLTVKGFDLNKKRDFSYGEKHRKRMDLLLRNFICYHEVVCIPRPDFPLESLPPLPDTPPTSSDALPLLPETPPTSSDEEDE